KRTHLPLSVERIADVMALLGRAICGLMHRSNSKKSSATAMPCTHRAKGLGDICTSITNIRIGSHITSRKESFRLSNLRGWLTAAMAGAQIKPKARRQGEP